MRTINMVIPAPAAAAAEAVSGRELDAVDGAGGKGRQSGLQDDLFGGVDLVIFWISELRLAKTRVPEGDSIKLC